MSIRIELNEDTLEKVSGGDIAFDPQSNGTYKMRCRYTGLSFTGISAADKLKIDIYAADQPNTKEGEEAIIAWAVSQGMNGFV